MGNYITVDDVKTFGGLTGTTYDVRLALLIPAVEAAIESHCRRWFYAKTMTRQYDAQDYIRTLYGYIPDSHDARYVEHRSDKKLWLDADLIGVTTLLNGNGLEIPTSEIILYPLQGPPYRWIEIKEHSNYSFTYTNTPQAAYSVTGSWGDTRASSLELVKTACKAWTMMMVNDDFGQGISSKSIGDFSVSYDTQQNIQSLPDGQQVLRPPRDVALLLQSIVYRDIAAAGVSW